MDDEILAPEGEKQLPGDPCPLTAVDTLVKQPVQQQLRGHLVRDRVDALHCVIGNCVLLAVIFGTLALYLRDSKDR